MMQVNKDADIYDSAADDMGPGQLSTSPEMPLVFEDDDQQRQQDKVEKEQHEDEEQEQAAEMHGQFCHPMDPVDEENFDDAAER